jgi:hypothetical protein
MPAILALPVQVFFIAASGTWRRRNHAQMLTLKLLAERR